MNEECCNVYVTSLIVSGFVEVSYYSGNDYLFILEVTWSDGRTTCVRRTYKDFINFQSILIKAIKFDEKTSIIPKLKGLIWRLFGRIRFSFMELKTNIASSILGSSAKEIETRERFQPPPKQNSQLGYQFFRRYDRQLAEEREDEIHNFMKCLLSKSQELGRHSVVVDFFEPRATDPIPYRTRPDGACYDTDADDPFSEDLFDKSWVKKKDIKTIKS